jgi:hypothetical protein
MSLRTWVTSSLVRHFPATPARMAGSLRLDAARHERLSAQVAMRWEPEPGDTVAGPVEVRVEAEAPASWQVRVRRVGYVPLRHHNTDIPVDELDGWGHVPGYVPDPLFDETMVRLPAFETHAFWLTIVPAEAAAPGDYVIKVRVVPAGGRPHLQRITVRTHDVTIAPRHDFAVTHWFYNDAILDAHGCATFDERYWSILPNYVRNVVEHGQDTLYTPVFTPPLDGVKRPSQLLRVQATGADTYAFDWRDVKRYVDLAQRCGVRNFEWTHLFTQWGVKHAIRIYEDQGASERLLWAPETGATSGTYQAFLRQFLPELHAFLKSERLLGRSFFHVSDEPHGAEHLANYQAARNLLRELAPWMKVMDALSQIEFARQGLTDMPIASIHTALDFRAEDIPCWCYYCCGPRGRFLNRLLDHRLPMIRMNGWLFYRWPFQGFLHWGYNYWYESQTRNRIDPFSVQDGLRWPGWAYGDPFMVYPGPDGPLDSLRWEVFGESLQDYALLQTLGIPRDDTLLAPLRSFEDFPKTERWLTTARRRLLQGESKI